MGDCLFSSCHFSTQRVINCLCSDHNRGPLAECEWPRTSGSQPQRPKLKMRKSGFACVQALQTQQFPLRLRTHPLHHHNRVEVPFNELAAAVVAVSAAAPLRL
eukprot:COSAG02_NODE_305_length_25176_cov_30.787455_19_plen_103_part_00